VILLMQHVEMNGFRARRRKQTHRKRYKSKAQITLPDCSRHVSLFPVSAGGDISAAAILAAHVLPNQIRFLVKAAIQEDFPVI
jgi:hypothetical protein